MKRKDIGADKTAEARKERPSVYWDTKQLAKRYLYEKRTPLLLFLVCFLVFMIVFRLEHVPAESAFYAFLLCGCALFCCAVFDFYRYGQNHVRRLEKRKTIEYGIEEIRDGDTLLEEDYKELLLELYHKKNEMINKKDQQYEELKMYLSIWGHQIKTPITAMNLLLQNPEKWQPDEIRRELFEIESYVDITLQYMRLDSLNVDFVLKECRVGDMVRQAVKYFSRVFIRKKLSLHLGEMKEMVVTDEKWMVFALKQVLSNALKYTRQGGITITTSYHQDGAYHRLVLVIEDTGQGIAKEDLPRIFEKAFTGYNGHMDQKATGIGLFLTKQVLDQLGHEIIVTSVVGKGTKVRIICEY